MRGRKKIVLKKIELDSVPAVDFFGEGGSQGGGSVTAFKRLIILRTTTTTVARWVRLWERL